MQRRAAAIATAVAVPVTVLLAFVLTAGHGSPTPSRPSASARPLPGVTVTAPERTDTATQAACVQVFAKLPVQLGGLAPRKTETNSSFVAAWGDPPTVLRCGVNRPADLVAQSAALAIRINGVDWLPRKTAAAAVFTSIDRAVYVEVSVPSVRVIDPSLSDAVRVLPAVCESQNATGTIPEARLCTHRR